MSVCHCQGGQAFFWWLPFMPASSHHMLGSTPLILLATWSLFIAFFGFPTNQSPLPALPALPSAHPTPSSGARHRAPGPRKLVDGLINVVSCCDRCGPCRNIAPVFDQLSDKYPGVEFFKVDVDVCTVRQQYDHLAGVFFLRFIGCDGEED